MNFADGYVCGIIYLTFNGVSFNGSNKSLLINFLINGSLSFDNRNMIIQ